ncbi:MAG: hypothetical protein NTX79_05050 [Candidatus Micrarchaeota archaeon]|nr:hypothetical protein [Candidatus Micrarchaeota archaeon]
MQFEYSHVSDSLFRQEYSLTRVQEYVEMAVYSIIAFSLPFLLGHEQLLVGSVVNCALVLAALNLRGARLLPVIILPSIGAYLAGLVFGVASSALLYMIPFIWLGNAVLVLGIKHFVLDKRQNRVAALGIGATAKAAFLFLSALALLSFSMVPASFLAAMGIFQLATALAGGAAALAIQETKKRCLPS